MDFSRGALLSDKMTGEGRTERGGENWGRGLGNDTAERSRQGLKRTKK